MRGENVAYVCLKQNFVPPVQVSTLWLAGQSERSVLTRLNLSLYGYFQGLNILSAHSPLDQNAESLKRLGFPVPPLLFPKMVSRYPQVLRGKNGALGHSP